MKMSFSKAKIHRFNEISETTPSPADYNVTSKSKTKYGVIPTVERLIKTPSYISTSTKTPIQSSRTMDTGLLPTPRKGRNKSSLTSTAPPSFILQSELDIIKEKIGRDATRKKMSFKGLEPDENNIDNKRHNRVRKMEILREHELHDITDDNDFTHLQTTLTQFNKHHRKFLEEKQVELRKKNEDIVKMENKLKILDEEYKQFQEKEKTSLNLNCKVNDEFKKINEKVIGKHLFSDAFQRLNEQIRLQNESQKILEKLKAEMEVIESSYKDSDVLKTEWEQAKGNLSTQQEILQTRLACLEKQNDEKNILLKHYKNKQEILGKQINELEYYKKKAGEFQEQMLKRYEIVLKDNHKNKRALAKQKSLIEPYKNQVEKFRTERYEANNKYNEVFANQQRSKLDAKTRLEELCSFKREMEMKINSLNEFINKIKEENNL